MALFEAIIGMAGMAGAMSIGQGVTSAMNAKKMCQSLDGWNKQTATITEKYNQLLTTITKMNVDYLHEIGNDLDALNLLKTKLDVNRKLFNGTKRLQQIYGILTVTLVFFVLLLKYFNFNALIKSVI
jgi:hypothetical protein